MDNKLYYGCSAFYESAILKDGLVAQRQSGRVYVATLGQAARVYAASWAVGMHTLGLVDRPIGVIFEVSVPDDIPRTRDKEFELKLNVPCIPAKCLKVLHRFDLSNIKADNRAAYLASFLALLTPIDDPHIVGSPFAEMAAKIRPMVEEIRRRDRFAIQRGMRGASCFVL